MDPTTERSATEPELYGSFLEVRVLRERCSDALALAREFLVWQLVDAAATPSYATTEATPCGERREIVLREPTRNALAGDGVAGVRERQRHRREVTVVRNHELAQ